jgi:hypothetical protein
MKPLAIAVLAGVLVSGAALAQQGYNPRPGDADPYASKPGAPNPYATQGGTPPSSVRQQPQRDDRHRPAREEKGYGYAKDPHGTHLPYGTSQGAGNRKR